MLALRGGSRQALPAAAFDRDVRIPPGERPMKEGNSPSASPLVATPPSSPARPPLTARERLVCVPLGLVWLAILLLLAVPVSLYMTLLYFAVHGVRMLSGEGPHGRNG